MRLPSGGLHQFLGRGAPRPLEKFQHLGGLLPSREPVLLGRLRTLGVFGRLLGGVALVPDFPLAGATSDFCDWQFAFFAAFGLVELGSDAAFVSGAFD